MIDIKTDDTAGRLTTGAKIGIGVGVAAAALTALFVGLFILNKRRGMIIEDIDEETIDVFTDETNSIVTQNPLNNIMSDDDPFGDDFA